MLLDRMIGVLKLDVDTFEDIEQDQDATTQAAIVVIIVALLAGIGAGLARGITDSSFFGAFLSALIGVLSGWIIWSLATYFVGTSLFDGQADMGEMLRVIGFAYTPQLLGIIPCIGWIIGIIWTVIAGFIAVRQGLDLDNTKAFLTIVVGLVVYLAINWLLNLLLGPIGL